MWPFQGLYWRTQRITDSPVITLAVMNGSQSRCELCEPCSSQSLPSSWTRILHMLVSVFSKDSKGPPCRFLKLLSYKSTFFPECNLQFSELTLLSPQLSKSSELCLGTSSLPHRLQSGVILQMAKTWLQKINMYDDQLGGITP